MSEPKHIRFFNRDGTSQQQRALAEIDPLHARIDDRQLKDLLSFLWKIAEYIDYYDLSNLKNGHWQNFIGVEQAVMLSLIAAKDTTPMKYAYLDHQSRISETVDRTAYLPLFDLLYEHCLELKELYNNTNRILGRELFLSQRNIRLLESFIENLLTLRKGYGGASYDTYIKQFETFIKDMDLESAIPGNVNDLSDLTIDQLDAKMRNDLYELHQNLQKLFETVIGHAKRLLEGSLKRQGDYQPHIGLILTFLHLFKSYQDQLNGLTAKHLKYYYRDVLKIDYRDKIADKVFVIIQLAKQADTCKLEKGTAFKAGKDSEGKNLSYKAIEEFIANKTKVADLKSLYSYLDDIDGQGKSQKIGQNGVFLKRVRAATKADSLDGKGKPLDEENPQFPPFGNDSVEDYAELGFAFSSPVFRLKGGKRTITISALLEDKSDTGSALDELFVKPSFLDELFEIYLTCEKGWEKLSDNAEKDRAIEVTQDANDDKRLNINLVLESNFPSVVDFSKKVHSDQFDEKWPVCKLVLKQTGNQSYYELCHRLYLVSYKIMVEVEGLKDLVLQNDFGLQKPEKPIMIFGSEPMPDAAFYIGSQEVFAKKLDALSVKWDWVDYMDYTALDNWYLNYTYSTSETIVPPFPKINISFKRLVDNEWYKFLKDRNEQKNDIFVDVSPASKHDSPTFELSTTEMAEMSFDDTSIEDQAECITTEKNKIKEIDSFKKYSLGLQDGFIKINLIDNVFLFGHKDYSKTLVTNAGINPKSVNPPITPMIQNVELNYASSVDNTSKEQAFFHLHPFGISKEKVNSDESNPTLELVYDISEEGYFYIGLQGLKPPQNISLLFQFVEGTGDFTVDMPEKVQWRYLTKDGWKEFDERGVLKDGTRDFSGTGIVSLSIPADAASDSTLMPMKYHWLRASVTEHSRSVNMLASVQAQAMELVFDDQGNAADHYDSALPAKKIGKLLESMAKVKAVTQPFASFGGRPKEKDKTYFIRVSERLRHKDRAVTLWDYEHLVLERFPQIHKVKCLNHMSANSEIAPGHVKVVVIPNLANLNAVNILQPAVSNILRDEIREFLEERCSTFVKLRVDNPRYEQLKVKADVTFHKGCDEGYYNKQLSDDIKNFLTPWEKNIEKIQFHEKLHSSVILNFIEERKYVDYISNFSVKKTVEDEDPKVVTLGDIVRSRADSLFVSAEHHLINKKD